MEDVVSWKNKTADEFTEADANEMMKECYERMDAANTLAIKNNNRLFKAIRAVKGEAFLRNLRNLLAECEVGSQLGVFTEHQIVRATTGKFQHEQFGREIKGYWCQQWAVGCEGDSWEGYVYVELKTGRYLKSFFSM